jgi:hypothetical protein
MKRREELSAMGREARVKADRRAADVAAMKTAPKARAIKVRDADYWQLKSVMTSAAAARQALQQAHGEFTRANNEQNDLVTEIAKRYGFTLEVGTQIGLDDKSRTIAIAKVPLVSHEGKGVGKTG